MSRYGQEIDIAGLLAAAPTHRDANALLLRILGNDIWDADTYRGWMVRTGNNNNKSNCSENVAAGSVTTCVATDDANTNRSGKDPQRPPSTAAAAVTGSPLSSPTSFTQSILGLVRAGIQSVFPGSSPKRDNSTANAAAGPTFKKRKLNHHLTGQEESKKCQEETPGSQFRITPNLEYTSASDHTVDEDDAQPPVRVAAEAAPTPTTVAKKEEVVLQRRSKRTPKKRDLEFDAKPETRRVVRTRAAAEAKTETTTRISRRTAATTTNNALARPSARIYHQDTSDGSLLRPGHTYSIVVSFQGMESLGSVEALVSGKGISKKRGWQEVQSVFDEGEEQQASSFVLSQTNRLSAFALAKEYDEIFCKKHDNCYPLKPFVDDAGAINAVTSFLDELLILDAKLSRGEELDKDFVEEQQIRNRTARIMQGRRSQEKNVRDKEKLAAERLANKLLQNQWINKKRATVTVQELEWKAIQDRPVLFQGNDCRRTKMVGGIEACPCNVTDTRASNNKNEAQQRYPCRLCSSLSYTKSEPIPVKNMMPMVRQIDVDAPVFLERDNADDVQGAEGDGDSKTSRVATRGSRRMKFDPKKRNESVGKLVEVKASMDFVEQYNAGLLE